MGGDSAWWTTYKDPVRWKFKGSSTEFSSGGISKAEVFENDQCTCKLVSMHKPTHDPGMEQSGEYPFSHHLSGRRRLWEIRFQMRFKKLPQKQLYFGLELGKYTPISGMTRQAQKALVSACRRIVGDCYHSAGDDPSITQGEAELPTFVMPLWAFDQFVVSTPGTEPDISSDLEGQGMRRSDGVRDYIRAMTTAMESFSTEKIYTFCFWGVSQFLDIFRWEVVGGLLPGVKMDFNKLCGEPPVHISIYELPGMSEQDVDKRHLSSRKKYFFSVAMWSTLKPPSAQPISNEQPVEAEYDAWGFPVGKCASGMENVQEVAAAQQAPELGFDDLLGLSAAQPAPVEPAVKSAPLVESFDLLDLGS